MGRNRKHEEMPYICAAFKDDVEVLLKKFADRKSFSFKDFAEVWLQMKFSLVFMGKENVLQLRAFTQESFKVASEIILGAEYTFSNKIAATYLLYGLYFKQIGEVTYKIRVDNSFWSGISQMLKYGEEVPVPDLVYTIHRLKNVMAFDFVKCISLMGPKLVRQQKPDPSDGEQKLHPEICEPIISLMQPVQITKTVFQVHESMWNHMIESGQFEYTQPWEKTGRKERERELEKLKHSNLLSIMHQYLSCKTWKDLVAWHSKFVGEKQQEQPFAQDIGLRRSDIKSSAMTVQVTQRTKRMQKLTGNSREDDESQSSGIEEPSTGCSYRTRRYARRELGIRVEGVKSEDENESDIDGELKREFRDLTVVEDSGSEYEPPSQMKKKGSFDAKKIVPNKYSKKGTVKRRGRPRLTGSQKLPRGTKCQMMKASQDYRKAMKGKKITKQFKGSDEED